MEKINEANSCWHLFRMNYMGALPLQLQSTQSNGAIRARGDSVQVGDAAPPEELTEREGSVAVTSSDETTLQSQK
jgi:hypothetical protein